LSFQNKIKCPNCGFFNTNSDYCVKCGTLINPKLKRDLEDKKRVAEQKAKEQATPKSKFGQFIERNRAHKNIIIRLFFQFIYGIWFIVMAIGAFIAWLFAAVAA